MPLRERLKELGWQQGVLLSPSIDDRLIARAHYEVPPDACLLVVSQTCDLIQDRLEVEPYFEVLCLRPLSRKPDKGCLGGKNSRRIEFEVDDNGSTRAWSAIPFERHLVDREVLLDHEPTSPLDTDKALPMILTWLTRRYTRAAFPDEFNDEIKKRQNPINKKFTRLNEYAANVLVRLTPFRDLCEGETYNAEILLLMSPEQFDDAERYDAADLIRKELEDQLNKCERIEAEVFIEATSAISLDELSAYRDWDYSYLSFRDPESSAEPITAPGSI